MESSQGENWLYAVAFPFHKPRKWIFFKCVIRLISKSSSPKFKDFLLVLGIAKCSGKVNILVISFLMADNKISESVHFTIIFKQSKEKKLLNTKM